jgi:hypothetical protein
MDLFASGKAASSLSSRGEIGSIEEPRARLPGNKAILLLFRSLGLSIQIILFELLRK